CRTGKTRSRYRTTAPYTGNIPDYPEARKSLRPGNVPDFQHGSRLRRNLSSESRGHFNPTLRETRTQRIRSRTSAEKERNSSQRQGRQLRLPDEYRLESCRVDKGHNL